MDIIEIPFTDGLVKINLEKKVLLYKNKELKKQDLYEMSAYWKEVHKPFTIETIAYIALWLPELPMSQFDKLEAKTDTGFLNSTDLYLVGKPIESLKFKGFYVVKGFEGFVINSTGQIKRESNGRDIKVRQSGIRGSNKVRYWMTSISNTINKDKGIGRYRVLLLAFKTPPSNPRKLDVNHIDGNPSNDDLTNLEWCTRQQNIQHALDNRFLKIEKRVLVKHIYSQAVTTYRSLTACAEEFNTDRSTIQARCSGEFRIYDKLYLFKFETDDRPWPKLSDGLFRNQAVPELIVYDVLKNEVYRFKDAVEALKVIDCNLSLNSLTSKATHNLNTLPQQGFHFYRSYNFPNELPQYNDIQLAYIRQCKENNVRVDVGYHITKVSTGEEWIIHRSDDTLKLLGFRIFYKPYSDKWLNGEEVKGYTIKKIFD